MADDLSDIIKEVASGPKKVAGDEAQVEQHSIQDLIAADEYNRKNKAAKSPAKMIKFYKMNRPGAY